MTLYHRPRQQQRLFNFPVWVMKRTNFGNTKLRMPTHRRDLKRDYRSTTGQKLRNHANLGVVCSPNKDFGIHSIFKGAVLSLLHEMMTTTKSFLTGQTSKFVGCGYSRLSVEHWDASARPRVFRGTQRKRATSHSSRQPKSLQLLLPYNRRNSLIITLIHSNFLFVIGTVL